MLEESIRLRVSRSKRRLLVFLCIMLTLIMAACNSDSRGGGVNVPTNPPSTPGTPPAPTPPAETTLIVSLESDGTIGQAPLRVTFTASVSEDATLSWYVGDRQIEVDGNVLTYTFANAGTYMVVVSARNGDEEVANDSVTIEVSASTDPSTPDPTTPDPTTPDPTTPDPTTPDPTTPDPTTPDPTTPDPTTPDPTTPDPTTPDPTTPDPSTPDPSTPDPTNPSGPTQIATFNASPTKVTFGDAIGFSWSLNGEAPASLEISKREWQPLF